MVHSREDYDLAVEASQILFGQGTAELLNKLDEATFLSVFEGVPQFKLSAKELGAGIKVADLLAEKAMVFPSKGELRRTIQGNGLSINKNKISDAELVIDTQLSDRKEVYSYSERKEKLFLFDCRIGCGFYFRFTKY